MASSELAQSLTLTLGEGFILLAWWKAIVLLLPIMGWAWVVSSVYDKHAMRFHLARQAWNVTHMLVALVAVLGALLLPIAEPKTTKYSDVVSTGVNRLCSSVRRVRATSNI